MKQSRNIDSPITSSTPTVEAADSRVEDPNSDSVCSTDNPTVEAADSRNQPLNYDSGVGSDSVDLPNCTFNHFIASLNKVAEATGGSFIDTMGYCDMVTEDDYLHEFATDLALDCYRLSIRNHLLITYLGIMYEKGSVTFKKEESK